MRRHLTLLTILLAITLTGCGANVLFVGSYSEDDPWTRTVRTTYEEALRDAGLRTTHVDFHAMNIDSAQTRRSRETLADVARVKVMNSPAKLVVCQDSPAIGELGEKLKGTPITILASGVRSHPAEYGLTRQRNCFGVWTPTDLDRVMSMIAQVAPRASRLAVLSDTSHSAWATLVELKRRRDWPIEVVSIQTLETREEWLASVNSLQNKADAILCVSMTELTDSLGRLVPERDIAAATARESRLPTVGLTRTAVMFDGILLACAPSPKAVGRAAAELTAKIANTRPEKVEPRFVKTTESVTYVNLALAEKLGVSIPLEMVEEAAEAVPAGSAGN